MSKELLKLSAKNIIVICLWLVVLTIIISPNVTFLNSFNIWAVQLMLGFIAIGVLFFFFNYKRLFTHAFLCAAVLCVFLKNASNKNLKLPEVNEALPTFKVAHVNLSSVENAYQLLFESIANLDPDILSVQEFDPQWEKILNKELKHLYPYKALNTRIDPYGMAFYSKSPINHIDTIFTNEIPMLQSDITLPDSSNIYLTNIQILPSINSIMDSIQEAQMLSLGNIVNKIKSYQIVLGDFNMVYWSNRIRNFRQQTNLLNSRRDVSQSVLSVPYDHIFYDDALDCVAFREIIDSTGNRLGIVGTFQLNMRKTTEN